MRQVELDEVGEVPERESVQSGDVGVSEGEFLKMNQIVLDKHVCVQCCHLVTSHV